MILILATFLFRPKQCSFPKPNQVVLCLNQTNQTVTVVLSHHKTHLFLNRHDFLMVLESTEK